MSKILVVDDNKSLADTLALILRSKGYETSVAYNGRQGYEAALSLGPDLVISDVAMPEMSGIEMAIKISQELNRTKILLVSGQSATLDLLKDARTKGYEFELIAKPVHPMDLLARVKCIIAAEASRSC